VGGDLRAAERTYQQQMAQVAGRAGRGAKAGEVLIHPPPRCAVIAALAAGDRDAFTPPKLRRGVMLSTPFGRWAAIIVSSEDEAEATGARAIGGTRSSTCLDVDGPGPSARTDVLHCAEDTATASITPADPRKCRTLFATGWVILKFPEGGRVGVDRP
jgi:primosomal protein N' (replication factor Y)